MEQHNGRSQRRMLTLESTSSECSRVTSYERLSESMRLDNEYVPSRSSSRSSSTTSTRKNRAYWGILTKVLSFTQVGTKQRTKQIEDRKTRKQQRDAPPGFLIQKGGGLCRDGNAII